MACAEIALGRQRRIQHEANTAQISQPWIVPGSNGLSMQIRQTKSSLVGPLSTCICTWSLAPSNDAIDEMSSAKAPHQDPLVAGIIRARCEAKPVSLFLEV
jgi:hypothetical protein